MLNICFNSFFFLLPGSFKTCACDVGYQKEPNPVQLECVLGVCDGIKSLFTRVMVKGLLCIVPSRGQWKAFIARS